MKLLEELGTDFSGGMNDSAAATAFRRNEVAALLNGRVFPDATVGTRSGTQRAHAAALNGGAQGYGAVSFRTDAGTKQWIAFVGDAALVSADEGASWTMIATGLRTDYWSFATMSMSGVTYLLAANGSASIYTWDGTTWGAVSGAPSGVKYIATFNGRLYASGHSGSLVQASAIADFNTWTIPSALTLQAQTNDADTPSGLYQIGPHLLVFKRESTSYIDGFGNSDIVVAAGATGFSRSVGCIAFRTIVGVGDNAVCWLSTRGVEMYVPGQGIKLVSTRLRTFFAALARSTIDVSPGLPSAAYDAPRQNYHLALPKTGTENNRTVVINVLTGAASIDQVNDASGGTLFVDGVGYLSFSDTPTFYEARSQGGYLSLEADASDGEPVTSDGEDYLASATVGWLPSTLFSADRGEEVGAINSLGYDGFVRYHETGAKDDVMSDGTGGAPIGFFLVSRPHLFAAANLRKRVRALYVSGVADADAEVTLALRTRGVTGALRTLTLPASSLDQPRRVKALVSARGDNPQIELRTTAQVRFSLLGAAAEILREEAA